MTDIYDKDLTPEEIAEREAWSSPQAVYEREYAAVELLRQAAYSAESDILKYKWEETLDPADHAAFLDAKAAIRERYPYPVAPTKK